ncbi:hypothetical protein C0J52_05631 [Blattella germanica]|nr:hypothetical protein C0J52_05631 [Blattella germanica]
MGNWMQEHKTQANIEHLFSLEQPSNNIIMDNNGHSGTRHKNDVLFESDINENSDDWRKDVLCCLQIKIYLSHHPVAIFKDVLICWCVQESLSNYILYIRSLRPADQNISQENHSLIAEMSDFELKTT